MKSKIMVKYKIQMMHIKANLKEVDIEEIIHHKIIIIGELEVAEELIEVVIEIIMIKKMRIFLIFMINRTMQIEEEAHHTKEVVEDLIIKITNSLNLIKLLMKKTMNKSMIKKLSNNNPKELLEDTEEIIREVEIMAINNEELLEELEGLFKEVIMVKENTLEETEVVEVLIEAAEEDIKMVIKLTIENQNINNILNNKHKITMMI